MLSLCSIFCGGLLENSSDISPLCHEFRSPDFTAHSFDIYSHIPQEYTMPESADDNSEKVPKPEESRTSAIRITPDVTETFLSVTSLTSIAYDISQATPAQRTLVLDRVVKERDQTWASEALQIKQHFTPGEQEQLIRIISDPRLSFETLTLDYEKGGKKLTQPQAAYLMVNIESDEDDEVAYEFYITLVESGVAVEPNETERWWIERLERKLVNTSVPEIAAYILENTAAISAEDRERLEKLIR